MLFVLVVVFLLYCCLGVVCACSGVHVVAAILSVVCDSSNDLFADGVVLRLAF